MDTCEWEYFEEQIATRVLTGAANLPDAIYDICVGHRDGAANALLLAAISFVTHLDNDAIFDEENAQEMSISRYRIMAALAADVALLNVQARTCGDLQQVWRATQTHVFCAPKQVS